MRKVNLRHITLGILALGLTGCSNINFMGDTVAPPVSSQPAPSTPSDNLWQGNTLAIWGKLQNLSLAKLETRKASTNNADEIAWLQLAIISKRYSTDTSQLVRELLAWRDQFPSHPANALIPADNVLTDLLSSTPPQSLGLLLPLEGKMAASGQQIRDGFLSAYYEGRAKIPGQQVAFYKTNGPSSIAPLYQQATMAGADFVIGPLLKEDVQALSQTPLNITTLALNYTAAPNNTNLFKFGLLPEDEAKQLAEQARQQGYAQALIIAPEDQWGARMSAAIAKRWNELGGSVRETWVYKPQTNFTADVVPLEQQHRHDTDVVFLLAPQPIARQIVPLLGYRYAVFAPSSTISENANTTIANDLKGVTVCGISARRYNPLYALGRDSYLLSHELRRLIALPNFPLYGATGILVAEGQEIHRHLSCVTIHGNATD